jgi:hypothetical protein
MEMELASSTVIESYVSRLNVSRQRQPKTRLRGGMPAMPRRRASRRPVRCACAVCASCVENARWERIFNEKFADPDYYRAQPTSLGSSLNSWA